MRLRSVILSGGKLVLSTTPFPVAPERAAGWPSTALHAPRGKARSTKARSGRPYSRSVPEERPRRATDVEGPKLPRELRVTPGSAHAETAPDVDFHSHFRHVRFCRPFPW